MRVALTENEDGTRTYHYADGRSTTYRPTGPGPRAGAWIGSRFYPDLELAPDAGRVMPETVPDDVAFDHPYGCRCVACRRPEALYYKQRKRLTPAGVRPSGPRQPRR